MLPWPRVSVSEGGMLPLGDTIMIPLTWKLRLPPSHLELLISLYQQGKNTVTVLAGVTDPDYHVKLGLYPTTEVRKVCLWYRRSLRASFINSFLWLRSMKNCNSPIQARLLMAQTLQEWKSGSFYQVKKHNYWIACWGQREYRIGTERQWV